MYLVRKYTKSVYTKKQTVEVKCDTRASEMNSNILIVDGTTSETHPMQYGSKSVNRDFVKNNKVLRFEKELPRHV